MQAFAIRVQPCVADLLFVAGDHADHVDRANNAGGAADERDNDVGPCWDAADYRGR